MANDDLVKVFAIGFAVVMVPLTLLIMGTILGGEWTVIAQALTLFSTIIIVLALAMFAVFKYMRR